MYCFFKLVSYSFQRESIKGERNSWLWILIQIFLFPAILPWLPIMQLWAWTPLLVVNIAFPPPHCLSKMMWDTSTCGYSWSTNSEAVAGWGPSMPAATKVLSLRHWKRKTCEKGWPLESTKSAGELSRRAERAQNGGYFLETQIFSKKFLYLIDNKHFYVIGT